MKDIRVRFRKLGRVKYISHLDLTRTMTRAVRRANLPIWYTEGFNRHPYLTFAAPLSLGFEGVAESMDFRIIEEIPMEDLLIRLNGVLPKGLEAYSAGEPVMKAGDIASAFYRLTFTGNTNLFSRFISQDTITSLKRSKKGVLKEMNLKPFLEKAMITYQDDGSLTMELLLPCNSTQTINPMLIAAAYQDYAAKDTGNERTVFCDVLRLRLLDNDGRDFI